MSTVQSVERSLSILEILSKYPEGIRLTELSSQLGLAKSTTHRLLLTLMHRNFVKQDERSELYSLGMQVVTLASSVLNNIDIRGVAHASIVELAQKTNEVVHLCIKDDDEVIYIDKVDSDRTIRMFSQVGRRVNMHCTGVGKVMLANLPIKEVKEIISKKGLPQFTPSTITDETALFEHLEIVKEQGYAIDEMEHEELIAAVAAPIYDYNNKVIAAISIAGPNQRITKERIKAELIDLILETSHNISQKMGYLGKTN
ncbi:IclR family transcriptional regulator [Halalkalibacter okhensis]|uniref:Glycerol operon regulatory protein n=1 Tax=Halalkalibacter okhensis TaxID=333138 RepID=A0A0B0I8Y6_9BACI|nr:IclR family transcriptional regulator [Halalkalibacter okhensis]KHF38948.1 IclR family transcriptional regulator [Halalkalibacter okhensis]